MLFIPLFAGAQTSNMARIIAREMLRVGVDTSKYFTSITDTIYSGSTDRQAPTAAAVYEAIAGGLTLPTGTHDGQILVWNGSAWEEYSGSAHGNGLYWDSTNGWQEYGLIASNQVFASSGTVGAFAKPAMRTLVAADIPTISLTAGVSGTLPAANGGTGNASYTTGDILYASGTTTLSKLADVATGNALISGGVGVAPSYGKIGLTTHVSGTLPVTNGGTGLTSATQGDIVYASAANTYSLLAKSTTATRYLSNTGTSNNPAWAQVALSTGVSGTLPVANGGTGAGSWTANQVITGNGTSALLDAAQFYYNHSNDRVGIGTSAPAQALHVVGSEHIGGSLRINAKADSAGLVLRYHSTQSNSSPILRAYNSSGTAMFHIHRTASGNSFFAGNGGLSQSSGSQNTSLGVNALLSVNSGVDNVAIGYRAGEAVLGALKNMLIGSLAGLGLTSGGSNMFIGYGSGAGVTTGTQNVAIGTQAMVSAGTTAGQNIAFGTQTGQYFTGTGNTAIGHLAGQNTSSGDNNVFIGINTGRNSTGTGNVYIGANISGTFSESSILRVENSTATAPLLAGDFSANKAGVNIAPGSLGAAWHVTGTGTTSSTYSGIFEKSDGTDVLTVRDDGRIGVLVTSPQTTLDASGGTDGVVLPVGTDAQRPSVNGTIRGNSDNGGVEYRVGNQWYRLVASQTPSVAAGAAAGTGATAILFDGSNDLAGGVTLTTGTSATTGTLFTLTFADAFFTGLVIKVTLTPADSDAAAEITKYYVSSASTTTFVVTAATALTDSTEYKIYYQIGQ